jgi:mannose/cellobiose epimerase-like protein (N-acyl-D-glucosamine 2-epimerase family)
MDLNQIATQFQSELETMLLQDILPFWINHTLDHRDCGFLGRISGSTRALPSPFPSGKAG